MSEAAEFTYSTAAPPGMGENGACREVRGSSMGALVHGSLAFYDHDEKMPTGEMYGELVIASVKGRDDLPFIRFLEPGSKAGLYTLRSATGEPMVDVELSWAALVKWIRLPTERPTAFCTRVASGTARPSPSR